LYRLKWAVRRNCIHKLAAFVESLEEAKNTIRKASGGHFEKAYFTLTTGIGWIWHHEMLPPFAFLQQNDVIRSVETANFILIILTFHDAALGSFINYILKIPAYPYFWFISTWH
jgi:hypothetical protein